MWFLLVLFCFVHFVLFCFLGFFVVVVLPLERFFLCFSLQGPHSLKYSCLANLRKSGAGDPTGSCHNSSGGAAHKVSMPHEKQGGHDHW